MVVMGCGLPLKLLYIQPFNSINPVTNSEGNIERKCQWGHHMTQNDTMLRSRHQMSAGGLRETVSFIWRILNIKLYRHESKHHLWHEKYNDIYIKYTLTSFTPILAFAEVSMNAQLLNCLARFSPWSFPTTRSSSKSHLLPTKTIGTSSVSFTRKICSRRS